MAGKDGLETQWTGHDLYDADGEKIGTVEDILVGDMAGGLKWLVVKTGLLGTKKVFVPAGEVRSSADRLVVSYTKDRLKSAPDFKDEHWPTIAEEQNLCSYYGLDYVRSLTSPVEGCAEADEEQSAP